MSATLINADTNIAMNTDSSALHKDDLYLLDVVTQSSQITDGTIGTSLGIS